MSDAGKQDFPSLYNLIHVPIVPGVDCGDKCAPFNETLSPFCCDTRHAVPSAYRKEWLYLSANTDLWHEWVDKSNSQCNALGDQTPPNHILLACKGHKYCQRQYRTVTCRSFPFYPYVDLDYNFIGLSYYWDYEDRCWIISNLDKVSSTYRDAFITCYDYIFELMPEEKENFRHQAVVTRRIFGRQKRPIPLLHRDKNTYLVSPKTGQLTPVPSAEFPKHEPYRSVSLLQFPDEVE